MNTPTLVLLVVAACWPIISRLYRALNDQAHKGAFTWRVVDNEGHVYASGSTQLHRLAVEQSEAAKARMGTE